MLLGFKLTWIIVLLIYHIVLILMIHLMILLNFILDESLRPLECVLSSHLVRHVLSWLGVSICLYLLHDGILIAVAAPRNSCKIYIWGLILDTLIIIVGKTLPQQVHLVVVELHAGICLLSLLLIVILLVVKILQLISPESTY